MLKVGIIGCGKIADQHADAIQNAGESTIVSAYDAEELMARQFCERFHVKRHSGTIEELFDAVRPGVIHVTTPPQSHYALGLKALQAGCHVYMEKPFTLNTQEAEELIRTAEHLNLKITAGHNTQFAAISIKMRQLIADGYLGGPPVHMESYYCYDFGDPSYAKALLGDKSHWVRAIPGKLLQNIISHGISKVAEYMTNDDLTVIAHGFTSQFLKGIGENDIIDELRVIINDGGKATAYFTFSSQIKPPVHQFRIYGQKNSLILDYDSQSLVKVYGKKYKSYLALFVPPYEYGKQYFRNTIHNIESFAKCDLHMNYSMRMLVEAFYRSIRNNTPPPIPYSQILVTSKIMDDIFRQIDSQQVNN